MSGSTFIFTLLRADDSIRTFTLILRWGLILAGFLLALWLINTYLDSYRKAALQGEIRRHGLEDVVIREIDREVYDDTLANTIMGNEIAGSMGAVFGALSGRQQERVKSIRFWIKLGNGEKRDITLSPRDDVCKQLLRFIDKREFNDW
ncbi:MAG: hypothetical protein WDA02_03905 [Saccharofermentanales bacterium]